ncbi:MAG: hypothetical protein KDB14_23780 [Planctomycetales bacterium]|nr:hypothetical protein [Planctomycetales bacterium]
MPPMPLTPPTQRNTDNDSLEVTPKNLSQPPTNPATPATSATPANSPADEPKAGEAPPGPPRAAVPSATPAHQDVVAPPVPTPSLAPPAASPAAPINHSPAASVPAVWTPQVSPVAPNLPSVWYVCPPLPAPTPNYLPQLLPNTQVPNAVEHRVYTPQNPTPNRATSPPTSRWRYGKQAVRGY